MRITRKAMAKRSVVVLLLLLIFFSGAVGVEKQSRDESETKFNLQTFLEKAHELGIIKGQQETELRDLALEVASSERSPDDERGSESFSQTFSGVFLRAYDQFSLLNLLYFSGALLVMGAFTLFSTLAWTNFGYGGVTLILLVPLLFSGFLGIRLWDKGTYPILGGLLCTISTSLVPFTVYCAQQALKWWPGEDPGLFQGFRTHVRGGWVVMEISTIITGFLFLWPGGVLFPFLLFPVSWMLWFLSMDLAPFLPEWYRGWRGMWEARRILSLGLGLSMLVIGRLLEARLGSDPDFGFWLYLFGLSTFWFAVTFAFPDYDLHGSLYLLINIALCLIGSHLNRTTFQVFATMGVLLYTVGIFSNYIKPEKSLILWLLKALSVVGLFSQALRTGGSIEVVIGLVCMMAFGCSFLPFVDSGSLYQTFLLFTSLGFVGCAAAFERPLNLWLFDFPDASWLIGLASSLSVLLYHTRLIKYTLGSPTESLGVFLLHLYRVGVSVCVSVVFFFLRQPGYAWTGGIGLTLIATNLSSVWRMWSGRRGEVREYVLLKVLSLVILIVSVVLSLYVESSFLYVVSCTVLMVFILSQLDKWKIVGCVFSVTLVLLAVPLQSRFLMTIGVVYIFIYLTHLAYDKFKNSMMFSLTLIGIGLSIICLGYLYQSNEPEIQKQFEYFTPEVVKLLLTRPLSKDWTYHSQYDWYYHLKKTDFSYESFMSRPYRWILWPAPLMHALSKGKAPYVSTMVACGIIFLLLAMAISNLRRSSVIDLDSKVKVTLLNIALSREYDNHGVVVKIKGTKSPSVGSSPYVAMDISGERFWRTALGVFGKWKVNFARAVFLPLTLSPHLISFVGFSEGSTEFSATILLGTGHKGTARLSHRTALETLAQLKRRDTNAMLTCTLLYSNSWYAPYSKLAEKQISLGDIVLE